MRIENLLPLHMYEDILKTANLLESEEVDICLTDENHIQFAHGSRAFVFDPINVMCDLNQLAMQLYAIGESDKRPTLCAASDFMGIILGGYLEQAPNYLMHEQAHVWTQMWERVLSNVLSVVYYKLYAELTANAMLHGVKYFSSKDVGALYRGFHVLEHSLDVAVLDEAGECAGVQYILDSFKVLPVDIDETRTRWSVIFAPVGDDGVSPSDFEFTTLNNCGGYDEHVIRYVALVQYIVNAVGTKSKGVKNVA